MKSMQTADRRRKGALLGQSVFYHEVDQRDKSFFILSWNRSDTFPPKLPHIILPNINFKESSAQCEGLLKNEENFLCEGMHLHNPYQADREGLEFFFTRLSGQAALCCSTVAIKKKVDEKLFLQKAN